MEPSEKIDTEIIIKTTLYFSSLKEGLFNYNIPLKTPIANFTSDKKVEPSNPFFEYICYKNTIQLISSGKKINPDTLIITDNFLSKETSKEILKKDNAKNKKNIIICIQNMTTLKWNLIAFLNLEEQIKNYLDINTKKPIMAKILSSNSNSDEDDFILNDAMDKLENSFDFKSPDDIQFEVDSFNIGDQPNTGIFILNFINGLIIQEDSSIFDFIKKLYEEGSNNANSESRIYFNSFNNISDELININETYQKELEEYTKNNPNNIDDELNSDEEEEALKIMERENEEAINMMRQKGRKLRQKLYKEKLRDQNMIMYKEFGIIKEEDNESESESIDFFGKMKEKEEKSLNLKNSRKNNQILNNLNVNININVNSSNNNCESNSQDLDEIKNIFKRETDIQIKNKSKSEKKIKLNALKELEEAIQEFESEQEPLIKSTEENINQKKNELINNKKIKEELNKDNNNTEKNNNEENKTNEEIKKNEVIINNKQIKKVNNNNVLKIDNIESKKRASVPKSQIKLKKLQLDLKNPNPKLVEKLKKSFTSTKRPSNKDITKDNTEKEKEKEDNLFITNDMINYRELTKRKSMPVKGIKKDNNKILIKKAESNTIINQNKEKEGKQINININKKNNIPINKEPKDNLSKKNTNLNNIIKSKNIPKRNNNQLNKKTNSKISKTTQESKSYLTKKSTSSSNISEDTNNSIKKEKEIKQIKNKLKPFIKEKEIIDEKSTLNISSTDNPINILPPPKLVERNAILDFVDNEKRIIKNKEKKERDNKNNTDINLDNIINSFSEKDKISETSDKSHTGRESRHRNKKNDKLYPPGKIRNSHRYQYGKLDQEAADKICGCIGEQAIDSCNIF